MQKSTPPDSPCSSAPPPATPTPPPTIDTRSNNKKPLADLYPSPRAPLSRARWGQSSAPRANNSPHTLLSCEHQKAAVARALSPPATPSSLPPGFAAHSDNPAAPEP